MNQRAYPPKAWRRRRLFQLLSIPVAKGVLLTAGVALFVGVPVATFFLALAFVDMPGFWIGFVLGLLVSFAVWWAWLMLYDD